MPAEQDARDMEQTPIPQMEPHIDDMMA